MSKLLPNLQAVAAATALITTGNANTGAFFDAQTYKGPLTFVQTVGMVTSGLGAANVRNANVSYSSDNATWTVAGNFPNVINAANASNIGNPSLLTFDVRLGRYWLQNAQFEGTNVNVPYISAVIGQKERV